VSSSPSPRVANAPARLAALAPFEVRSFRFQWPADLATSWAFEMETIILGWYVLVETGSIFMLTLFASLQYLGTLISPMMGVMGDRVGQRNVLCAMRCVYLTMASIMMAVAYAGAMTPVLVLCIAAVTGLVRPSDIGMRAALTADIMPANLLMGAMSIQRTTQDSAKIVGALTGAALVAALGVAPAYTVVACMYATSVLLTLKAGRARTPDAARLTATRSASPWRDLKEGLAYVWNTPLLLAVMLLAFMLNVTAFPQITGLMPYVAKEVYHADQKTLGYLLASFSSGALLGSIVLSRYGGAMPPARMMVVFASGWYAMLMMFAHTQQLAAGIPVLVLTGFCHSMGQVPMAATLLRNSDEKYRGRIMGIRMLAIYGNLPGLWIAGPLIAGFGYPFTATLYCLIGIGSIVLITACWRAQIWRLTAPANSR
jgi:predicted MFS family arabinose efflux permease